MENDFKFQIAYLKAVQQGQIKKASAIDAEYQAYLQIVQAEKAKKEDEICNQEELKSIKTASNNILSSIDTLDSIDDYIRLLNNTVEDRRKLVTSFVEDDKLNKFASLNNMIEEKIYNLEKPEVEIKMLLANLEELSTGI